VNEDDTQEEDYRPAVRPGKDIPGGERVTFEREGRYEQSLFGGGAQDIEASILGSTERNINLIGWTITGVHDVVGEMGMGGLQELTLMVQKRGVSTESRTIRITGDGIKVEIL
jgi:hypothetical protein